MDRPGRQDHGRGGPPPEAELYRALFLRSLDGIVVVDRDGIVLEWNAAQEALTGIPRAEAVGRRIWDVQFLLAPAERATPEFLEQLRTTAQRDLSEGADPRRLIEDEIRLPDGSRRTIQSMIFSLQSEGGLRVCATCRDVTGRRLLEEDLREREALLLQAEHTAGLGHWASDLRTGVMSWSDEVYRVLGHEPGAFPPGTQALERAMVPEDRARIFATIAATAQDGLLRRATLRILTPAGAERVLDGTVELLRDSAGAPARLLGTVQDVTERCGLERALGEASQRKDEFLATLSHELRNPLAAIQSCLYVLARTGFASEPGTRMQRIIQRQMAHLTRLVDDLLDLSRISRGKVRLSLERVDLCPLVERIVDDHRPKFGAAGVELEGRIETGPFWIDADVTRVEQILGNLLSNAVKFTPPGGRVTVALELRGAEVVLRVRDTGEGIEPDLLGRLFEPFTQAGRPRGGLGLGLALVRDLAALHGGRVRADSAGPGRGAEFVVHLPLADAGLERDAPASRRLSRPLRVLVIDDDRDAAEGLEQALTLEGHVVRVAHEGGQGLAVARSFHPEVVLCDLSLPVLDGFEVARLLRSDPDLRQACLVALTGHALPADVARCAEAGFDRHIAKPLGIDRLEEILADLPGLAGAAPHESGPDVLPA